MSRGVAGGGGGEPRRRAPTWRRMIFGGAAPPREAGRPYASLARSSRRAAAMRPMPARTLSSGRWT